MEAQQALRGVTALAEADLQAILAPLAGASADRVRDVVELALPALADQWGDAAAALAAEWYVTQREAAGLTGEYVATLAAPLPAERLAATARWGVSPLYSATPDYAAATTLLAGGLQRAIADQHRATITGNVAGDPKAIGYARHASANACAFCRMLATRTVLYRTKESATQAASRRAGNRPAGQKYHDACHCLAVPVFAGQAYKPPPYVADWAAQYADAHSNGDTAKQTLARWRASEPAAY